MNLNPNKLLVALANACMTKGDLAEKANISKMSITNFSSGKTNPRPGTIGKMAKALNVKVEDLID